MKILANLLLFCCSTFALYGQTPFTITTDNFPLFGYQLFDGPSNPNGNNLIPAPNGNWNLSSYHNGSTVFNDYQVETLPFYTSAGIDIYLSDVKNLTPTLGYYIDNEFDFNANGVYDKGIYVGAQAYSLGQFTGNAQDSLTFPNQGAILQNGRQIMKFPATYTSAWASKSRRIVDFKLTVAAAGLNKTPCQHVYTIFRSDTIVGWGKLRVYSNGASSIPYDVLINRTVQYTVDSFFVGGAPAPPTLLAAFGITQGQQTAPIYRYTAFREGNSTQLAVINYSNSSFTTPTAFFFDTNNLTTSAVSAPEQHDFSTLLFPNPSPAGVINLQITGNIPTISAYEILDNLGRSVQSGAANGDNGLLQVQLKSDISAGAYLLHVLDDKKQTLLTAQFMLER